MGIIEGEAILFPIDKFIKIPFKTTTFECQFCHKVSKIVQSNDEMEIAFCPSCGFQKDGDAIGSKTDVIDI